MPKSVGGAVVRNRVKRQLRETWRELAERVPPATTTCWSRGPGLAEPAETRGHDWLVERVAEVLEKAAAVRLPVRSSASGSSTRGATAFGLLTPPNTCKYHPSCSQYALDALRKHGLVKGSAKAAWRLLRCNPWSRGGVDYA